MELSNLQKLASSMLRINGVQPSALPCCTRTVQDFGKDEVASEQVKQNFMLKFFATPLIAMVFASSPISQPPVAVGQTADFQKGAPIFRRSCIGCHDAGGNIIQPGATLFPQDLTRNGIYTEDEIFRVTYYGKGRMPGFGERCTPRGQCTFGPRLTEDEIKLLAEFVKTQADQGWPKVQAEEE